MFPLADLRLDQRQLCDIQGRLFELARARGYDCPTFIEAFMNSDVARRMDGVFDFLQWAGEEYLLEELDDEEPEDDESEEYDEWVEKHEAIEDMIDDINDRLEELAD